jgi:hypothetical protein
VGCEGVDGGGGGWRSVGVVLGCVVNHIFY